MANKTHKISATSLMHYVKLVCRSLLFLIALVVYIVNKSRDVGELFFGFEHKPIVLSIIWIVFAVEIVFRFFPSRIESMGCQKQFERNYVAIEGKEPIRQKAGSTIIVAAFWLLLNGIIGLFYFLGFYDAGVLILISLAFSVCDMICILYFCPFQTWVMKNKCCTTCRIYNWDYAMMFTPLIFIINPYSLSLVGLALVLLLKWEIVYRRHPERFVESSNETLACKNCKEKLCQHKKQLKSFLREKSKWLVERWKTK